MESFGADVGGVIMNRANDGTDTSFFSGNYLRTTRTTGSFETIRRLVDVRGAENVWIVSKCGPRIQARTLDWMEHHRFYEQTGVLTDHVIFCAKRHQKAGICRELGIRDFVDDRPDVLIPMDGIVDGRFLFNPRHQDLRRFRDQLSGLVIVRSWEQALPLLLVSE